MSQDSLNIRPDWVSDEMFPFKSQFFLTSSGYQLHYIDEGKGEPIVFVHGNPSWSFEFRHLIKKLQLDYRCIALDHIGFGLSSRSSCHEDHHPKFHAQNFIALMDHLKLQNVTLFLTDWGGPIGLEFARKYPDRIKRIVVANTWSWPVGKDFHFISFSFIMSSWLGQFLIKRFNIFVNKVMPKACGNKNALTEKVMEHYRNAQPSPSDRSACAALPGHIVGATDWLHEIWNDRKKFIDKPALILWGLKDIAFRKKELEYWKAELANFEEHIFEDCGHFLAEEAPEKIIPILQTFMVKTLS